MKGLIIWWDRVRRGSWSPTKPIVLINYKWVRINGQTTKLSTTNCPNSEVTTTMAVWRCMMCAYFCLSLLVRKQY